jgi:hypothetical protein
MFTIYFRSAYCLGFIYKIPYIKIDDDFNHRNFDRISEPN